MNHLGSRIGLLEIISYGNRVNSPIELSPFSTHEGYFHVTAEPVSTCVQEIFAFFSHKPLFNGYEIVNATFSFFVSWIPVLNR